MLTENQLVKAFNAERTGAKFPIKFDDAWKKLGYSRKDAAKRAVLSKLIENEDYIIDSTSKWNLSTTNISSLSAQEKAALLLREDIYLSCDGYDHFCMLSDTPEGREERIRFIGYKKAYIAGLERALLSEPNPEVEALKQENTRLSERVTELEAKIGATHYLSSPNSFSNSNRHEARKTRESPNQIDTNRWNC